MVWWPLTVFCSSAVNQSFSFDYARRNRIYACITPAGAKGYLLKESSTDQLAQAIRAINRGKTFFPDVLLQSLQKEVDQPGDNTNVLAPLTRREREVFFLVIAGHTTKDIAQLLDMSHKTAENHRGRILKKCRSKPPLN